MSDKEDEEPCLYSAKKIAYNEAMREHMQNTPNIGKKYRDKLEKIIAEDEELKEFREWLEQDEGCPCKKCREFYKRKNTPPAE